MLEDAQRDVADARHRLQAHVAALPGLRAALLDSRENLVWVAAYPDRAENFGFATSVALGLRAPVESTLGTRARVEYSALIEALEADADTIAKVFGGEHNKRLGIVAPRTPLSHGTWLDDKDDPDLAAWKRAELQRAKGLHRWSADPIGLADEARDLRP